MRRQHHLGIAYYYMNQPDKALQQFDCSLAIDHFRGIRRPSDVGSFAHLPRKISKARRRPGSSLSPTFRTRRKERAQQALESVRSAHPNVGAQGTGSKPSGS